MQPALNNGRKKVVAGSLISLIVIALIAAIAHYEVRARNAARSASTNTAIQTPAATPATSSAGSYKDGTYSASSSYYVPHGGESIKVTLMLKNGVIADSSIVNSENNPESAQFQEQFASEYKSSVVGKNISSVQLSYVAGASDTTQAFDDALQQIMNQAHA